MPHKDIKDHERDFLAINDFIEQAQLNENCPCGSTKHFGSCCGRDMPCECHSHRAAIDCCYSEDALAKGKKKRA